MNGNSTNWIEISGFKIYEIADFWRRESEKARERAFSIGKPKTSIHRHHHISAGMLETKWVFQVYLKNNEEEKF